MAWPEPVTYLLLVVLGYALTRVVDLFVDWQRRRLRLAADPAAGTMAALSATGRQRLLERRAAYGCFRERVHDVVSAALTQGAGTYGMLYRIRDAYGDLLRIAPPGVIQAADSVIRCVTLLVNLGPSDQRYAMYTRAARHFDAECECDQGQQGGPATSRPREFSVLGGDMAGAMTAQIGEGTPPEPPNGPRASPSGNGSGSAPAPT
jgi:hypothetical protein